MNTKRDTFDLDCSILSDTVHQQQGGTCYAHATATVMASAERWIEGRIPKDHWTIVSEITKKFGSDGGNITRVLENECKKRLLKFRKIDKIEEAKYLLQKRHALVGNFVLYENQWQNLLQFVNHEAHNILTIKHLCEPEICPGEKKKRAHAVAVGGYDEKENCWIIKNSWGKESGYHGYWRVSADNGLTLEFHHVYFRLKDLTDVEIFNYIVESGSDERIHSEVLKRGKIEEFQVRFFAMAYQSLPGKAYSIFKLLVNYIKNWVTDLGN